MLKLLKKLLGFSNSGVDGLGLEIRELIKGKEIDPQKLIEMQTAINEMEAKHRTIFVAGWRPFIGWVCGIALAYNFIIRDMLVWYMGAATAPPALPTACIPIEPKRYGNIPPINKPTTTYGFDRSKVTTIPSRLEPATFEKCLISST